jgi:multiple sugar transport system permease protein
MGVVGRSSTSSSFRRKRILATAVLALVAAYTLLPVLYVLISVTKTEQDLFTTFGFSFGRGLHVFENLARAFSFQDGILKRWLVNSALYSTTAALGATLITAAAGYAFAKFEFTLKGPLFAIIIAAVMVPQTAFVVPLFLMMTSVGIVDTPWAVILPFLVFPAGVYLMRVYAEQGVPTELIHAARVDGAGEFGIFFKIVLRLVAPGLVTVFLLAFVSAWNNYFLPLVVLTSPENFPLTVGLANWYAVAESSNTTDPVYVIVLTGALISIIPIIALFLFLQRFWESGLFSGSGK